MSRELIITGGTRLGSPPTGLQADITLTPSPPYSPTIGAAVGTQVATATTSTAGGGAWTLTKTSGSVTEFLRLRATTGKSIVIELSRVTSASDAGTNNYRLEYNGDGISAPASRTFAATLAAAAVTITLSDDTPVVAVGTASGTTIVTCTATNSSGTGTWSTVSGTYGAFTMSGSGMSRPVVTSRAIASSDVGSRSVTVRYVQSGINPVTRTFNVTVTEGSTRTWLSGLSDNGTWGSGDITGLGAYKSAHGEHPEVMTIFSAFPSSATWAQIAGYMGNTSSNLYKVLKWCKDNGVTPIITLPVCNYSDFNGSTRIANYGPVSSGTYDESITLFANRVRNLFLGDLVIFRVGHESTHFEWRIGYELYMQTGGPAAAKNGWRRVIDKLRAGMQPSGNCLIAYCHTSSWLGNPNGVPKEKGLGFLRNPPYNFTYEEAFDVFYPGNDYVDIISLDTYDGTPSTDTNGAAWQTATPRKAHYDLAVAKSRKFGLDEWGLLRSAHALADQSKSSSLWGYYPPGSTLLKAAWDGYGDCPEFVANMFNWLSGMSSTTLMYDSFFRMFEGGYSKSVVDSGARNSDEAVHAIYQRSGGSVAKYKTPFKGKTDRGTSVVDGKTVHNDKGQLVGFDSPDATGEATKKYRLLWHGLTTPT